MQRIIKLNLGNYMRYLIILLVFIVSLSSFATDYHVDQTGGAANMAGCSGTDPGNGNRCTMAQANTFAGAGSLSGDDIVYLYDDGGTITAGIYNNRSSGSSGHAITWKAAVGERPVLIPTNDVGGYYHGILLVNVDYNVIDGVEIDGNNKSNTRLMYLDRADYNEIKNCTIHDGAQNTANVGVLIYDSTGVSGSKYNWLHDNTIYGAGYISASCDDSGGGAIKIANLGQDYESGNNTIEDNHLYYGSHHVIQTFSKNNVIRNNIVHNEGWMVPSACDPGNPDTNGKYGNRNFEISDKNNRTDIRNLIEGNRVGHAGKNPDVGNGSNGIELSSSANIVRYNFAFNNGEKGFMTYHKANSPNNDNHIYNNTSYITRGIGVANYSLYCYNEDEGSKIINNILVNGSAGDINPRCAVGSNENRGNWITSDGSPGFVDTDISDPTSLTLPNLTLESNSGAIDNGTYLTKANGSGSSSTTLIVDDSFYFQAGSGSVRTPLGSPLSNIQADYIAIGSISNTVQISDINYSTHTITLASAMTWKDGDKIWLYRNSKGIKVLRGGAPDIGASEYFGGPTGVAVIN